MQMAKSVQELQDILAAKMKEVDAIQVEIEQAKIREQVRPKLDLMMDFVLTDDKLCKQIALLDSEECGEVGRKLAKSLSTVVKKALEGDAPKIAVKDVPKSSHLPDEVPPAIEQKFGDEGSAAKANESKDVVVAPEKKPRRPRVKKEPVDTQALEDQESKVETEFVIPEVSKDDGATATAEEAMADGSVTAAESESVVPVVEPPVKKSSGEKRASGSRMFNPARMMEEMKLSNQKK
jgi:hypothetical protein